MTYLELSGAKQVSREHTAGEIGDVVRMQKTEHSEVLSLLVGITKARGWQSKKRQRRNRSALALHDLF
jgi:hypothetical protein